MVNNSNLNNGEIFQKLKPNLIEISKTKEWRISGNNQTFEEKGLSDKKMVKGWRMKRIKLL